MPRQAAERRRSSTGTGSDFESVTFPAPAPAHPLISRPSRTPRPPWQARVAAALFALTPSHPAAVAAGIATFYPAPTYSALRLMYQDLGQTPAFRPHASVASAATRVTPFPHPGAPRHATALQPGPVDLTTLATHSLTAFTISTTLITHTSTASTILTALASLTTLRIGARARRRAAGARRDLHRLHLRRAPRPARPFPPLLRRLPAGCRPAPPVWKP